ncbi:MAG: hypothetical protein OQK98_07320 [Gammaproteobacteria bacterium]|nr:hypothetical protein [Gammaproteobacteria bacterium]
MPIKLEYNENLKYLLITAKGNPTVKEADIIMDEMCNSDVFRPDVNSLLDTRELLFDHIDIEYIQSFVTVRKKFNEARGCAKVAILSNSKLAAPLIKLFTILSRDLNQKIQVFRTVEEAELWLCEDLLNA